MNRVKPKFTELDDIKIQIFINENPIISAKTTCCVCGFLLDVEATWESKHWLHRLHRLHMWSTSVTS